MNRTARTLATLAFAATVSVATLATLAACGNSPAPSGDRVDIPAATTPAADPYGEDAIEDETLPDAAEPTPELDAATTVMPMDNSSGLQYEDGLAVKVGKPAKFRPSDVSAGHNRGNHAIKFTVTFLNESTTSFDLGMASAEVAFGADGVNAEQVFDTKTDFFEGTIAPGRKRTFTLAFSAPTSDLSVIDVAVSPSWEHQAALFTGSVKK